MRAILAAALAATLAAGCRCAPDPPPMLPPMRSPLRDAGPIPDTGPAPDAFFETPLCFVLFSRCEDGDCSGHTCVLPSTRSVPVVVPDGGAPPVDPDGGGLTRIEVPRFAVPVCSAECDPGDPDACGTCGRCLAWSPFGRARIGLGTGVCHLLCSALGECPAGYHCDPHELVCLQDACDVSAAVEDECALAGVDADGDGIDEALMVADEGFYCDRGACLPPAWGECEVPADCGAPPLTCLRSSAGEGMCARVDCRRCADMEGTCVTLGSTSTCVRPCEVGADAPEDRVGARGHGAGCAAGFACAGGGCVPGTYNDVAAPNVGAPCAGDADCFSPYGHGFCAGALDGFGGVCSVRCLELVGVVEDPALVCDVAGGEVCDEGGCIRPCSSADECPGALACSALPGGRMRTCRPECNGVVDCRTGERCRGAMGLECAIGERGCRCSP